MENKFFNKITREVRLTHLPQYQRILHTYLCVYNYFIIHSFFKDCLFKVNFYTFYKRVTRLD